MVHESASEVGQVGTTHQGAVMRGVSHQEAGLGPAVLDNGALGAVHVSTSASEPRSE